jgi:hypothetical protein
MLRIQRRGNGEVVLTVYGRLEAGNVSELSALLSAESTGRPLVLDIKDVVLVNRDVIRFLRTCEADGVELRNCPSYIRAWITQEAEQA